MASALDIMHYHAAEDASNISMAVDLGAASTSAPWNISHFNSTMAYQGHYKMPVYVKVVFILFYSMISILSVGGNVIVCYIVLAYQRMRTVTNYFLVNLACSDILMAVLCIPFTFVANLFFLDWPFGNIMCPIVTYAQAVAVFLCAFTLVSISLDRYIAVIYPLRPRMTTKQAFLVIGLIWFLSLAVPLPVAIVSKVIPIPDFEGTLRDSCIEDWPQPIHNYVYSMVIMVLQYFMPLFVLMFTYTRIGIVIWVKKTPGEAENNRDQRLAASKRKMVKMMITVVVIYALCWLPLHTITLIGDSHPHIWDWYYIQLLWTVCHWLAMSNCCYNPMVYCWMNSRFRNGFRYVLRFCPCVKFDRDDHGPVGNYHTYISTMRSTVCGATSCTGGSSTNATNARSHEICIKRTSPSPPSRYRLTYRLNNSGENIPMSTVHNGVSMKLMTRNSRRTSDQGYGSGDQSTTHSERALLTPEELNDK